MAVGVSVEGAAVGGAEGAGEGGQGASARSPMVCSPYWLSLAAVAGPTP